MERKIAGEADGQVLYSRNADTLIHTHRCYAETDKREKNRKRILKREGFMNVWMEGWIGGWTDGLKEVVFAGKGGREGIELEEIGSKGLG